MRILFSKILIFVLIFATFDMILTSINPVNAFNNDSLFACVQYFFDLYNFGIENMSEEEKANFTSNSFANPDFQRIVFTETCLIGYEHMGKYPNVLSLEEQQQYLDEYGKIAVSKIIGGALSGIFSSFSNSDR